MNRFGAFLGKACQPGKCSASLLAWTLSSPSRGILGWWVGQQEGLPDITKADCPGSILVPGLQTPFPIKDGGGQMSDKRILPQQEYGLRSLFYFGPCPFLTTGHYGLSSPIGSTSRILWEQHQANQQSQITFTKALKINHQ